MIWISAYTLMGLAIALLLSGCGLLQAGPFGEPSPLSAALSAAGEQAIANPTSFFTLEGLITAAIGAVGTGVAVGTRVYFKNKASRKLLEIRS